MQILKRTGAFREGHFVYPNKKQGIPELLSWVRAQAAQDQVESATAELESRQLVR
jgi:hypothetical protein